MSSNNPTLRLESLINAQHKIRKDWMYYIYLKSPITIRRQLRWNKHINLEQSSITRRIKLIYIYLWEQSNSILYHTPCVLTDPRGPRVKGCSWYNVHSNAWCKPDNTFHMACYET